MMMTTKIETDAAKPRLGFPTNEMLGAGMAILQMQDQFSPKEFISLIWRTMALIHDKQHGFWQAGVENVSADIAKYSDLTPRHVRHKIRATFKSLGIDNYHAHMLTTKFMCSAGMCETLLNLGQKDARLVYGTIGINCCQHSIVDADGNKLFPVHIMTYRSLHKHNMIEKDRLSENGRNAFTAIMRAIERSKPST